MTALQLTEQLSFLLGESDLSQIFGRDEIVRSLGQEESFWQGQSFCSVRTVPRITQPQTLMGTFRHYHNTKN